MRGARPEGGGPNVSTLGADTRALLSGGAPATFADPNVSTGGLTAGQRFVSSEGYKAIVANRGEQWTTGLIEVGPSDVALGMKGTWWWTRRAGTALARCGLTNTTGRGNWDDAARSARGASQGPCQPDERSLKLQAILGECWQPNPRADTDHARGTASRCV